MAARRILLLDASSLTAFVWSSGRVRIEGEFSPEPVGIEAFGDYLKKHRSSLFYLLADSGDEGFQLEEIPYVQGGDRKALLQRRLGLYFYNTPLSAAISLGRSPVGRRDEKLLFAALTRVETFTPWLDAMEAAEAMLAGIYSVPLVLAACGAKLLPDQGPALFVTLTRGGVRQTFVDAGKLHFSRLSQLATRSVDEMGRVCASESAKIYQYLVAQRQIPRGATLRTVVLAHASQTPALQEYCQNTGELQFEFADLGPTARKVGLKDPPPDSNADKMFIHALVANTPQQQFAPAAMTRYYSYWQMRAALTGVGWVILAGCLLFAGKTGLDVYEVAERTETIKVAAAADTERYNSLLAELPKISLSPDNLRALMGRFDTLQKRLPAPWPLMAQLGQALNDSPRIELVNLNWKLADSLDAAPKAAAGAAPANAAPPPAAESSWAVLEFEAQLPLVLVSDQRAQIELIENFANRLRNPQTDVRVLTRPFDIESDKPLRSASDTDRTRPSAVPRFAMRVARPL